MTGSSALELGPGVRLGLFCRPLSRQAVGMLLMMLQPALHCLLHLRGPIDSMTSILRRQRAWKTTCGNDAGPCIPAGWQCRPGLQGECLLIKSIQPQSTAAIDSSVQSAGFC